MGNPHSAGSLQDTENKWRMLKSFELLVLTPFAFRWPWAIQKFWKSRKRSQRWVRYSGYYVMIIVKVRVCDFNQWKIKDIWLAVDVRHSFSLPLPKCKQKYGRNAFKIAELAKPCGHCGEARRRPIWPKQPPVSQLLAFGRQGSKEQLDIQQYVWEDRFWTTHIKLKSFL